jgi:hypothetical protein
MRFQLKHGMAASKRNAFKPAPEYEAWLSMRKRCLGKQHKFYADYGGRGLRICRRWGKFENFYVDMGKRPRGKTLERINNNRGYTPRNCRWATMKEQAHNKRSCRMLTFRGATKTLSQWALIYKHPMPRIWMRIVKYGWSVRKALLTPGRKYRSAV